MATRGAQGRRGVQGLLGMGFVLSLALLGWGCAESGSGGDEDDDGCGAGQERCDGTCVSTSSDPAHCGECGKVCSEGLVCSYGECSDECATNLTECGASCANLYSDAANCGQCGEVCEGTCVTGRCESDDPDAAPEAPPVKACEEPEPWPLPSATRTVGDGSAASCTAQALEAAVATGGAITFACGQEPVTIAVSAALQVTEDTVLDGADTIILDGGGTTRIVEVATNAAFSARNLRFINGRSASTMEPEGIGGAVAGGWRSRVEIRDCTFEGNEAARGGGAVSVWTGSELTIVGSHFQGNRSWYGGAVYSLLSPLTIVNSVFVDNEAFKEVDGTEGEGGAIGTDGASESPDDDLAGTISICGSVIRNNHGRASGGGVYIWAYPPDVVNIERTTVEGNTAAAVTDGGSLGGGMRVSNGAITIRDSAILTNHSESHGGGLYLDCAPTCVIANTTLFGNEAVSTEGRDGGYGGAIFGSGFSLRNVTLAQNFAGGHGGAIFGGDFSVTSSLFVDNSAGNPWGQASHCSETGEGDGVLQWLSKSGGGGSDRCIPEPLMVDPLLAELPADNGGPTPTLLLEEGSPALGAGSDCEPTDQRGEPRDASACDLGALELP